MDKSEREAMIASLTEMLRNPRLSKAMREKIGRSLESLRVADTVDAHHSKKMRPVPPQVPPKKGR